MAIERSTHPTPCPRCPVRLELQTERDRYREALVRIAHSDTLAYSPPAITLRHWAAAAITPDYRRDRRQSSMKLAPITVTLADVSEVVDEPARLRAQVEELARERDEWEDRYEWLLGECGGTAP